MGEPEHQHSKHAVSVHLKKTNQRIKVTGNILNTLAKIVHGMMSEWMVLQVRAKTGGKHKGAAEGAWVSIGEIQVSCFYFLYAVKVYKFMYEKKSNNVKKIFNVLKTTSIHFTPVNLY